MNHILVLAKAYMTKTIDIYTCDMYGEDSINVVYLDSYINALEDNLDPKQITNALCKWSDKITKVDIKDSSLNIVLSTELCN